MRSTRVVAVATVLAVLVACSKKESDKAGTGQAAGKGTASVGSKVPAEPDHPQPPPPSPSTDAAVARGDLPPDLEQLAEMPELTAEATEAEISRRVDHAIEGFTAFIDLIGEHDDCTKMGTSLLRFVNANQRFAENLQKLSDPKLSQRLGEKLMERGTEWLTKMANNLQRCSQDPMVMAALLKLAQQMSPSDQ